MAANLLEQVGQQLQELENQLAAARAHNEFLQQELAGKDRVIARMYLPRLIKMRHPDDKDHFDLDDVGTVRQRLAGRDVALEKLRDMVRLKPTALRGEKLRKHEWKMTGIESLHPVPSWQEVELERERAQEIQEKAALQRSPTPPPPPPPPPPPHPVAGRHVSANDTVAAASAQCSRSRIPPETSTPTHYSQRESYQRHAKEDPEAGPPRQDMVIGSVEPPVPLNNTTSTIYEAPWLADRRPVCTRCFEDRHWCDSRSLCRSCKDSGSICVYKHCQSGARCQVARCLYIHPDQWSKQDRTWKVQHGSMVRRPATDPRKRGPSPLRTGEVEPGFRRKSICQHCFDTRGYCDFHGRCMGCREARVKCVRIHCKQGLACRSRRCPCVHPGQYDPEDTTWNVEHGNLW